MLRLSPLVRAAAAFVAGVMFAAAPHAVRAQESLSAAERRLALKNTSRYDDIFKHYSKRYFGAGFDWRYFKAQGLAESGLDPTAKSYVGARGVMQLMPSTYQAIASHRPDWGAIDDPRWNIAAGINHDSYLWSLWTKSIAEPERPAFMFASYNAGEGTIMRARTTAKGVIGSAEEWSHVAQIAPTVPRWRYRETLDYVRKIDKYYSGFSTNR